MLEERRLEMPPQYEEPLLLSSPLKGRAWNGLGVSATFNDLLSSLDSAFRPSLAQAGKAPH